MSMNDAPSPPLAEVTIPNDVRGRTRKHRPGWMAIATLLVIVGLTGSLYAFDSVRGVAARSHKALSYSSVAIASALKLAIQHEQDLIVSTESFIVGNPHPSPAQFTT